LKELKNYLGFLLKEQEGFLLKSSCLHFFRHLKLLQALLQVSTLQTVAF
jgi:hypothetical protein